MAARPIQAKSRLSVLFAGAAGAAPDAAVNRAFMAYSMRSAYATPAIDKSSV
jgi:hypothetical protein